MTDDTWFEEAQRDIAPLAQRVRDALLDAGFHEYQFPTEVSGFSIAPITPSYGWQFVQVQHVDWPNADVRPSIAKYVAALEKCGIAYEIEWGYPCLDDKWAQLRIDHKLVPYPLEEQDNAN